MYFYSFKKNLVQKRCYDYDSGSANTMSGSEDATDRGHRGGKTNLKYFLERKNSILHFISDQLL